MLQEQLALLCQQLTHFLLTIFDFYSTAAAQPESRAARQALV